MTYSRVIPCLDVARGRVVKGVQFQNLRDVGDPTECAAAYEQQGADEIAILDIAATTASRQTQTDVVLNIRRHIALPIVAGGGIRSVADAHRLLCAGADKVVVNTAAVARPKLLAELAGTFGRQCVVLALDACFVGTGWRVATHSGSVLTELDACEWAALAEQSGVGEVLLTSFDRDGTGSGYDLALIAAIRQRVRVPVIASGGARTARHCSEALEAGADAVLAATVFHDGVTTVSSLKSELREFGKRVRSC